MKIEANSNVDTNGFSLAHYLDGMTIADVLRVFPDARMEGYEDEEKGYDGIEAGFSTEHGNFYIYARWGSLRLGCLEGDCNEHSQAWTNEIRRRIEEARK